MEQVLHGSAHAATYEAEARAARYVLQRYADLKLWSAETVRAR